MQNQTKGRRAFFTFSLGAVVMLLMIGCASKVNRSIATMKISESEKAISVAKEINKGVTNAPVDLTKAEDKLARANKAMSDDEFVEAARLAEKATVDADYARIKAKSEKTRQEADQMRQNIANLRQDIDRISR